MFDPDKPFGSEELGALMKAMGVKLPPFLRELDLHFAEGEFVVVQYKIYTTPGEGKPD